VSNQRQIGIAYHLYAEDYSDYYPRHLGWADVGGQTPTALYNGGPAAGYAGSTPATNRPLNLYAKNVEVFHCPSDHGDALQAAGQAPSCWNAYGNSYLVQWNSDAFGVQLVTGTPLVLSIKGSEIGKKPASKIIQGDWTWHPNRPVGDPRNAWHNYKGQRRDNMLYGDGHIEYSKLPATMDVATPVDPNFTWW
jgi:hypothetical protein